MADALLTTKLGVQARGIRYVERERLAALLDNVPQVRLVLVSAPAGFGKTALLAHWLLQAGRRFAWLSLDDGDNDPNRFLRYLREAGRSLRGSGEGDRPASSATPPDPGIVTADVLDAFSCGADPAVLVLDDYHAVTSAQVHGIVATLLDRLPPNGAIAIATRADPPLPLARLRASGELVEVRADALRFTHDEAAAFLEGSMGLELRPDLVDELTARTEGWIALLQLAAVSLQHRDDRARAVHEFGASHRFLLDFVVEEVLASETEETRDFLVRTSILDRLTGPLCDVLTGRTDGAATLARLERQNMLLFPLDEERRWYRYHHLFAEMLRGRLATRDPQLPGVLHGHAADWLEAAGAFGEAVEHALRAPDVSRARRMLRAHWMAVMHQGDLWTVQRWLDALPPKVVREDPQLAVTYAFGQVLRGETEGVASNIANARSALEGSELREPIDLALVPYELELVESKYSELEGNAEQVIAHARAALELVPTTAGPDREALARGDATYMLARGHLLAGDDEAAAAAFAVALPLLRRVGNMLGAGHGARDLVRIELRHGDPTRALALCDSLLPAEEATEPAAAGAIHLARAEVLMALGRRSAARADADRAVELAHDGGDGMVLRDARALLERIPPDEPTRSGATSTRAGGPGLIEPLSPRELEVLHLVAAARSNSQIAAELYVTVGTIKAHVHSICGKLGAANRVQAIVRGRELNILD